MKRLKGFVIILGTHFCVYVVTTILWVLSFHSALFADVKIFFYRGLLLIALFGVLGTFAMALMRKVRALKLIGRDVVMFFVIFCCVNTVFFTHLPVTAERSVTVFLLGTLAEIPKEGISEEELKSFFEKKYINDNEAIGKRLHEQEVTGTVKRGEDGTFSITEEGRTLIRVYEVIVEWFNIEDKLVHP